MCTNSPRRYATITETRKRKAMSTSKRQACKKKSRQASHKQQNEDHSERLNYTEAAVSNPRPCHPMRTRSCKRNAHDAQLRHNAATEQQHNRRRRTIHAVHEPTTGTVSNVVVNDAEESHSAICRTEGCAHRPSPRKKTPPQDPDGMSLKKRVCCTMCACVTLQKQAEGPRPREPD